MSTVDAVPDIKHNPASLVSAVRGIFYSNASNSLHSAAKSSYTVIVCK